MLETLEQPQIDSLELEYRNKLQELLMQRMLGEEPSIGDQVEWVTNYGKKISDLIDYHEHDDIRELARAGNYEEAANRILEILESGK